VLSDIRMNRPREEVFPDQSLSECVRRREDGVSSLSRQLVIYGVIRSPLYELFCWGVGGEVFGKNGFDLDRVRERF